MGHRRIVGLPGLPPKFSHFGPNTVEPLRRFGSVRFILDSVVSICWLVVSSLPGLKYLPGLGRASQVWAVGNTPCCAMSTGWDTPRSDSQILNPDWCSLEKGALPGSHCLACHCHWCLVSWCKEGSSCWGHWPSNQRMSSGHCFWCAGWFCWWAVGLAAYRPVQCDCPRTSPVLWLVQMCGVVLWHGLLQSWLRSCWFPTCVQCCVACPVGPVSP